MSTSIARRNRRRGRRRAAGVLVAAAATTALAIGGTNSAAQAALVPTVPGASAGCDAGDAEVRGGTFLLSEVLADCTGSSPSIVAQIADGLIGVFAPDLPVRLSTFNGANATTALPGVGPSAYATIEGTGYASALVALGGYATANAQNHVSGAIAIAGLGGISNADANLLGLALALTAGPGTANATALPGGIVIVDVLGDLIPIGGTVTAEATALGGIASALWNPIDGGQAICTAVYATASVSRGGNNIDSCTSVLFIFQKYQHGDGPEVYAIKNPFSVVLVSPLSDSLAGSIAAIAEALGIPEDVAALLAGQFIPKFDQDLIRVSFGPDGPDIGTDLFSTTTTTTSARVASAPVVAAAEIASADDVVADTGDATVETPTVETPTVGDADDTTPTTEPDATEPESTESESTEPDATESEGTEPEATEPEATDTETTGTGTTDTESTDTDSPETEAGASDNSEPTEAE
ncbi:hypothetical protein [Gordonia sp. NB41Y]|uniref:hypothetical protein n=1 Tax=Gordonia sp. NB41Y TaxID=875808 RepID=UPI0002BFC68B|nr:hypothetical protein [Gordonia sp. NB41Y]WLP92724.1 hypothetical protein Q9K23_11120 [Gordonia sp. NB41Y]